MAYFLCTAGGNGKGNSVIVTCDSDFSGKTLTCTNGTKTYYKTCPSTSPYTVTFTGLSAGTWTISAEIEGTTYTTTVVVTDITTSLNYGFSWQRWVDSSSRLHSSDYASLAALLVDEEALRELFLEHSCVDYMASTVTVTPDLTTVLNTDLAAKWLNNSDYALDKLYANAAIKTAMDTADKYGYGEWVIIDDTTTPKTWGAKGNVPIMTSNSAPYGEASGNNVYGSTYDYFKAFDGNDSTHWTATDNVTNASVYYKFANPINARKAIVNMLKNNSPSNITVSIDGSNDGSTWQPINTFTSSSGKNEVELSSDDNYYLYLRATSSGKFGQGSAGYWGIISLQFYGRELSVSVPAMATNTTPYGVALGDSEQVSSNAAYKGFDGNGSTSWEGTSVTGTASRTGYLQYKFTSPMVIRKLLLDTYSGDSWSNGILSASNTGNNDDWTEIETFSGSHTGVNTGVSGHHIFIADIDNDTPYLYYRFTCTSYRVGGTSGNYGMPCFYTLQFYGKDYSEKEFEQGSTKKWLYDHGVEPSEILTALQNGTSTIVTKHDSDVEIITTNAANVIASLYSQNDLTDFSVVRCKFGNVFNAGNYIGLSVYSQIPNPSATGRIATLEVPSGNSNLPNAAGLDVSSVNATSYISVEGRNGSNGYVRDAKVVELWLE